MCGRYQCCAPVHASMVGLPSSELTTPIHGTEAIQRLTPQCMLPPLPSHTLAPAQPLVNCIPTLLLMIKLLRLGSRCNEIFTNTTSGV